MENQGNLLSDLIVILLELSTNNKKEKEEKLKELYGEYYKSLCIKIANSEYQKNGNSKIQQLLSKTSPESVDAKDILKTFLKIENLIADESDLRQIYEENLSNFMIKIVSAIDSSLPEESKHTFHGFLNYR